jgi:hypothetical protein
MLATEHLCWPPDIYCGHWIDGQILADGGTLGKRKPWDSGKFGWSRFDQDVVERVQAATALCRLKRVIPIPNRTIFGAPCEGTVSQRVRIPPGKVAPAGSNRSSRGDNEAAEASGVEGHISDLANMQAVT